MHKKLYRSRDHRLVSGVLGGFGEYFNVDPVVLRVLFAVFVILTGVFPGVIAYIVAIFLMPEAPRFIPSTPVSDEHTTL